MFNGLFQPTHLILILVVVLIVFGPGKLPEAGKALGKAMRDMRDAFSSEGEDKNNETEKPGNSASTGTNTNNVAAVSGTTKDKKVS